MNGELKQIDMAGMRRLVRGYLNMSQREESVMFEMGQLSQPMYAGTFNGSLLCLVGLVPPTLLSDSAYIWCLSTPKAAKLKIAFARHAIRLMVELRQLYPRIVGHCLNEDSWRWLKSLGATKTSETTFEIISWPHH